MNSYSLKTSTTLSVKPLKTFITVSVKPLKRNLRLFLSISSLFATLLDCDKKSKAFYQLNLQGVFKKHKNTLPICQLKLLIWPHVTCEIIIFYFFLYNQPRQVRFFRQHSWHIVCETAALHFISETTLFLLEQLHLRKPSSVHLTIHYECNKDFLCSLYKQICTFPSSET